MPETVEDVLFDRGEVLFETEAPLETAYFLLDGSVDLTLTLGERELELRIGANHFVGDAGAAVRPKDDGEPVAYRARAVAAEPVRAVAVPVADIQSELESCPPLLKAWFASFTSRVLMVVEQLSAKS